MNIENIEFDFPKMYIIDEIPLIPKENIFEKMFYDFLENCDKNLVYRKAIIQPEHETLVHRSTYHSIRF